MLALVAVLYLTSADKGVASVRLANAAGCKPVALIGSGGSIPSYPTKWGVSRQGGGVCKAHVLGFKSPHPIQKDKLMAMKYTCEDCHATRWMSGSHTMGPVGMMYPKCDKCGGKMIMPGK